MGATCGGGTYQGEDVFYVPQTGFSIPVRSVRKMGWRPDFPDHRDRELNLSKDKLENLPNSADLRDDDKNFPIYNQGDLGSCTANAICGAFHFDQVKQGIEDFTPSRLFVYFNERRLEIPEGEKDFDSGAYLRDGMKTLCKIGVCHEDDWVYDVAKFTEKPSAKCYTEAGKNKALEYAAVPQTLEGLKGCLAAGFPIVFGFTVYSSFFATSVSKTGQMTMPGPKDAVMGGHAIMAVGYDDSKKVFIIRNSWGEGWGDKGFFYMPYEYITQKALAQDFWTIKTVSGAEFPTKPRHS